MNVERKFRSLALRLIFSSRSMNFRCWLREKRRQLSGGNHVISVFLQLDDPYSYILSHYLPSLATHYDVELRLYLSESAGGEFQPAPKMLAEYAIADCALLALELGIPFLDKGRLPPTEHRVALSDSVAASAGGDRFASELLQALAVFWRGDVVAAAQITSAAHPQGTARKIVEESQILQQKLGHYSSAMLHYGGEWFWGVDRLHYLTARLEGLGATKSNTPSRALASIKQARQVSLPVKPPMAAKELPPIEFFFSFRSPYSYLALQRSAEIADAFGIELKLRPVLPMAMRGMTVPRPKLMYIIEDVFREARSKGLPFGKIADPLGTGAGRCLAVFCYAESQRREREFSLNAGYAIWAEAVDVATDKGMRKITGRTGLFWPDVEKAMRSEGWRATAEANRESMMGSGSWGVPTVRMGDLVLWGQDRDWLLVRHIEQLCDSGDGILV